MRLPQSAAGTRLEGSERGFPDAMPAPSRKLPAALVIAALAMLAFVVPAIVAQDQGAPVQPAPAQDAGVPTDQDPPGPAVRPAPPDDLPSLPYSHPFSLRDSQQLIDRLITALPESDDQPERYSRRSLRRIIVVVNSYLKVRDQRANSLADYRWEPIDRNKVDGRLIDNEETEWEEGEGPADVSALSFEIDRADAFLHYLAAYGEDGELVTEYVSLRRQPALLRHSIPRREVFHLWRPTTLSRIEYAYSKADPEADESPVVTIYAGRTPRPQYGKSAIFFLTRAEQRIEAGHIAAAREDLVKAREDIARFSRQIRRQG